MSTAPITPPAAPIAPATRPSMPGLLPISTRIVSEYWAEGDAIAGEDAIPQRSAGEQHAPGRAVAHDVAAVDVDARRRSAAADLVAAAVPRAHDVAGSDALEEVGAEAAVEHVGAGAGDQDVARVAAVDDAGLLDRVVLARRALNGAVPAQVHVHGA